MEDQWATDTLLIAMFDIKLLEIVFMFKLVLNSERLEIIAIYI